MTNSTGTNAVAGVSDADLQYLIDVTQHRPKYHNAFKELQSLRSRLSCIEAGPGESLTADMAKSLPGGTIDNSTYSQIEDALDAIEAPMCDATGRFLTLAERVAALSPIGVEAEPVEDWQVQIIEQADAPNGGIALTLQLGDQDTVVVVQFGDANG